MIRPVAIALSASLALAGAASAQALPAEVKLTAGAFTDQAGKPLYSFTMDTMRDMSHCEGPCAAAWPPLIAKPGSKPVGEWYLIKRADGQMQWAYKGHALYTSAKDAGPNELWLIAKP